MSIDVLWRAFYFCMAIWDLINGKQLIKIAGHFLKFIVHYKKRKPINITNKKNRKLSATSADL